MKQILIHKLLMEQVIDKPGIKFFIDEIDESLKDYFDSEHDENVEFECDHAMDDNGTHYFMHTLYNMEDMPNVVITSASKIDIETIKKAMTFKSENMELSITKSATCQALDAERYPDKITFDIYNETIGVEIAYHYDHGAERSDSISSITICEDGLSVLLSDASFYVHESAIQQIDGFDIESVELSEKSKSLYEKIMLDVEVNDEEKQSMSL